MDSHRHHVIRTRLVEANVNDGVASLLKELDTRADHTILDGSIRLVILSKSFRYQAQLQILQKFLLGVQLEGRGKSLQLVQIREEVAHAQ